MVTNHADARGAYPLQQTTKYGQSAVRNEDAKDMGTFDGRTSRPCPARGYNMMAQARTADSSLSGRFGLAAKHTRFCRYRHFDTTRPFQQHQLHEYIGEVSIQVCGGKVLRRRPPSEG